MVCKQERPSTNAYTSVENNRIVATTAAGIVYAGARSTQG